MSADLKAAIEALINDIVAFVKKILNKELPEFGALFAEEK